MVPSGWNQGRVKNVLDSLESGVSVNGDDRPKAGGEIGVLKISAVTYGIFNPAKYKTVIPEDVVRAKVNPKKGQVLISRSNTDLLVGASCYVGNDCSDLFLPDKLWQTVPKSESYVDMLWLSYLLASRPIRYRLSKLATGTSGSMKNITKGELLTLPINIPPPTEQTKIAQILSTWDKAIATVEKLIENSKQQKKALMQQLLTGKKRFKEFGEPAKDGELPEGWNDGSLSSIADTTMGFAFKSSDFESEGIQLIRMGNLYQNRLQLDRTPVYLPKYFENEYERYVLSEGDLVLSMTGTMGKRDYGFAVQIPKGIKKTLLNQRVLKIKPKPETNTEYLLNILKNEILLSRLYSLPGGTKQANLSVKQIQSLPIYIIATDEQEKIAKVLANADLENSFLRDKLRILQNEKKSLMQQLLTGKRRVKVDTSKTAEATA
jgi:type I restriction enzyme S subunit